MTPPLFAATDVAQHMLRDIQADAVGGDTYAAVLLGVIIALTMVAMLYRFVILPKASKKSVDEDVVVAQLQSIAHYQTKMSIALQGTAETTRETLKEIQLLRTDQALIARDVTDIKGKVYGS